MLYFKFYWWYLILVAGFFYWQLHYFVYNCECLTNKRFIVEIAQNYYEIDHLKYWAPTSTIVGVTVWWKSRGAIIPPSWGLGLKEHNVTDVDVDFVFWFDRRWNLIPSVTTCSCFVRDAQELHRHPFIFMYVHSKNVHPLK